MKLADLPIMPHLTPQDKARSEKALRDGIQTEGASSRRIGLALEDCPRYVDPDMAVDWRLGWIHEDQCLTGIRDRETGFLIPKVEAARCSWCNTDPAEAAARNLGPHATWCVHWRRRAR